MSLLDAFDLVLGIDTEYVSGENLDGVPYDENAVSVLSSLLLPPRHRQVEWRLLHHQWPRPAEPPRTDLARSRAPSSARSATVSTSMATGRPASRKAQAEKPRRKTLKPRNLRIAITAHFTRADLATFSDFKSLKKSFDHVRGTFASVKRPTIREIQDAERREGEGHADPVRYQASRPRRRRQAEGPRQFDRPAETGRARCRQRERRDRSRHRENGPRPRPPPGRVRRIRHSGTPKSRSPICAASPSSPRVGA